MNEPNWASCTEEELWKYVATHLKKNGIDSILVGGAVVSIYSEGAYESGDLDFIIDGWVDKKLPEVMAKIGFKKGPTRHYRHPKCGHLFVEFPTPPCAIGDDYDIIPEEIKSEGVNIKVFSPTDCIRDRLASYIHDNARECLDQAALVANRQQFNHEKVRKWCESEGAPQVYQELLDLIKK